MQPPSGMRHLFAVLLLTACAGREYYAPGTALAPNADFEVTMGSSDGGNRDMTVEIDRIEHPSVVSPDARRFAVWTIARGSTTPQLAGYLRYDRDAQSGRLRTVTPLQQFTVMVTAEPDGTPRVPSDDVVAQRSVG
jgi:hypothetical protein